MRKKRREKILYTSVGILLVLLVITVFQSFQISKLSSDVKTDGSSGLQQIREEITPKGTPEYGAEAGVSYDKVEEGLNILTGYATLALSTKEKQRYETIANSQETACKFCCGATKLAQNCGCSHNKALSGLTKWLIKNTDYSDKEILQEIKNWQILFFPKPTLEEELQERNIQPGSVGLPSMVGGC